MLLHALASWPAVTPLYCNDGSWRLHEIPFRAALRLEPEDRYLGAHLVNYHLARLIERTVPPGSKVLSFRQCADAYTAREILVVYQSAENKVLGEILWAPIFEAYMPNRVLEFSFPREPLRAIRVVQTAGPGPEQWSITDLRVVPPAPIRRFHADPNPWELSLAFDGKPVTRWRTWLPLEPGQFVEVDFGQPQTVEGVALQCTRDQPSVRLEVQGENASGQWRTLSAAPREREIAPIENLRRMAAGELKSRGVDYLLVFGSDPGADDFKLRAQEWGIRQVGELGRRPAVSDRMTAEQPSGGHGGAARKRAAEESACEARFITSAGTQSFPQAGTTLSTGLSPSGLSGGCIDSNDASAGSH